MPFAAALSTHPVSAYAAGEVIGEIFERLGPAPEVLVVVGRPGHVGAMEDIVATATRLLEPGLVVGGIAESVGNADGLIGTGPVLAMWAAQAGPAEPFGPAPPARPGAFSLALTTGDPAGLEASVAARISGPIVSRGGIGAGATSGAALGGSWAPSLFTLPQLVPVGPPLVITGASGRRIASLDGQPARSFLLDVLRDHAAARFGGVRSVALRILHRSDGTEGEPVMVAGTDRETGDVVLAENVSMRPGDLAILHVPGRDGYLRLAGGFAGGADADAALIVTCLPPGGLGSYGDFDPETTPLPAATLVFSSTQVLCTSGEGAVDREPAAAIALFP